MEKDLKKNLTITDGTDYKCEECGSLYFKEVLRFKKFSKILLGSPEDKLQPIPTIICNNCGHVNKEFDIDKVQNLIQ
jgi:uncharacterized Zn finger protein